MFQKVTRFHLTLLAAALLVSSVGVHALTLGRSRAVALIGQPLDMSIDAVFEPGEEVGGVCAEAEVFHGDNAVDASRVVTAVERTGQRTVIRVRSSQPIDEPVVTVYLRVGCSQRITRRLVVLAELAPVGASSVTPSNVAPATVMQTQRLPQPGAGPMASQQVIPGTLNALILPQPGDASQPGAANGVAPLRSEPPPADAPRTRRTTRALAAGDGATAAPAPRPALPAVTAPAASQQADPAAKPRTPKAPPATTVQDAAPAALARAPAAAPAAAPRPPTKAAAAAQAPAGAGERGRLKLDPLDLGVEREPQLKAATELLSTPTDNPGQRAAAAALWRALNAAPEDVMRDAQRLAAAEADLKAARDGSAQALRDTAALQARLQQAQSERYANGVVYTLGGLLLLVSGALAWVLLKGGPRRRATVRDWWRAQERFSELDRDDPGARSAARSSRRDPDDLDADDAPVGLGTSRSGGTFGGFGRLGSNGLGARLAAGLGAVRDAVIRRGSRRADAWRDEDLDDDVDERKFDSLRTPRSDEASRPVRAAAPAVVRPAARPSGPAPVAGPAAAPAVHLSDDPPSSLSGERPDFSLSLPSMQRTVNAEELMDMQQQADFFMSLGQHDQAIAVLRNHISENAETSALAYLDLFAIYHKLGRRDEYDQLLVEFRRAFNAQVPDFDHFSATGYGLEAYQAALSRIEALWPTPRVLDVIEETIFRKPGREDGGGFAIEAYRELLMLYSVAKDIIGRDGLDKNSPLMDLELPSQAPLESPDDEVDSGATPRRFVNTNIQPLPGDMTDPDAPAAPEAPPVPLLSLDDAPLARTPPPKGSGMRPAPGAAPSLSADSLAELDELMNSAPAPVSASASASVDLLMPPRSAKLGLDIDLSDFEAPGPADAAGESPVTSPMPADASVPAAAAPPALPASLDVPLTFDSGPDPKLEKTVVLRPDELPGSAAPVEVVDLAIPDLELPALGFPSVEEQARRKAEEEARARPDGDNSMLDFDLFDKATGFESSRLESGRAPDKKKGG